MVRRTINVVRKALIIELPSPGYEYEGDGESSGNCARSPTRADSDLKALLTARGLALLLGAGFLETPDRQAIGIAREVRARHKNGTTFPMDLKLSEFNDGAGRRFVGTIRDITERKWAEEEVRRRQAELAHVLRIATIERLAASLAHELNQPLTAIANEVEACATYVRSDKREPRRLLSLLERAGAEALRAGEIVHHLRDYVLRSEPRIESADLCEVIRNATHWLAREMEDERITLRLDLAPQGLLIYADRIQIEQVFVNLVQNAIDAIRDARGETREIRIRTSQGEDSTAEVLVDDTGIGFAAEVTARLYEPFFTTKAQGMGMGLAISRTIVELHRGRLSIEPRESGLGTTVRLVLPIGSVAEAGEKIDMTALAFARRPKLTPCDPGSFTLDSQSSG